MTQPPDPQKDTVLSKAEWLRIQDELNQVNKDNESISEAAKQREALNHKSKEVVKQWSNTIAGQRQKRLEAKQIREQIEEEKRKLADSEEANYQEQKRKDAIEKAQTQLYYQTDRVKGLHSALLLTEVLKEREAQIQLKHKIKSAYNDVDKEFMDMVKIREDEALRREREKEQQKKLEIKAVAEDLKNQIKANELVKEREKIENKKDGEETQRRYELYQREQRMKEERQAKQKRHLMQAHLEYLTNRELIKATEAQKQEAEEEKRKLFLSAKQKMVKLQKDKERELLREAQMRRETVMNKLTDTRQAQILSEEQRIAKAVAEQNARQAQQKLEEEKKRVAMLESIAAHRKFMKQEKEQRDKIAKQKIKDTLHAKKEADRIFSEQQQLKAQYIKENGKKLLDFNVTQVAEKCARNRQERRDEHEFDAKIAELTTEEEDQFQQYSKQIIKAAAEDRRNVFPLCKAAREGFRGGLASASSSVKPCFVVQGNTDAKMPECVSGASQNIKNIHEAVDIQEAKERLGFTW